MSIEMLELSTAEITVGIDPGRGCDVLSLIDRRSGLDVLFRTPWRARADALRAGSTPAMSDPTGLWLERYRGGWQTLCPNAGPPREVHGAHVGFHGEAAGREWEVLSASALEARFAVELFSIPLRIDRTIRLEGTTVSVTDDLVNLSGVPLEFDYSQHPAFAGAFLDGQVEIDTGARSFTSDPATTSERRSPGVGHGLTSVFPADLARSGTPIDIRRLPPLGEERVVFGWLHDFTSHWASITNRDLDLTVRLDWDGDTLPYAWLWQELNGTEGFPWFTRARVIAIEPASMQTSGPDRRSALRLEPRARRSITTSVSLENGSTA